VVYLREFDFDIVTSNDPILFSKAIEVNDFVKWIDAINDELKSMNQNKVWDIIELLEGYKIVRCK
jgi:cobalamin biosynthesis Co2+ chelatase CbiK